MSLNSTIALFYGFNLPHDFAYNDTIQARIEHDEYDPDLGNTKLSSDILNLVAVNWMAQGEAADMGEVWRLLQEMQCGCGPYYGAYNPGHFVYSRCFFFSDYSSPVDPNTLEVDAQDERALRQFCELAQLPWRAPQWHLNVYSW